MAIDTDTTHNLIEFKYVDSNFAAYNIVARIDSDRTNYTIAAEDITVIPGSEEKARLNNASGVLGQIRYWIGMPQSIGHDVLQITDENTPTAKLTIPIHEETLAFSEFLKFVSSSNQHSEQLLTERQSKESTGRAT
ncbi:MAG: hypothetical protein SFX19_02665 [Alphaproteobacteria bacterium]|nr:hypothetical protein [Alphaproteobacteria bacterium]